MPLLHLLFLFQIFWAGTVTANDTPFIPLPCGKTLNGEIEYVLTSYRANGQNRAVNQIGIRRVGDRLKFTARADLEDGYRIPGTDLESGCVIQKKIVFWKCIFEVEKVEKIGNQFRIVTANTEFLYEPGSCELDRSGTKFNALQVTKLLSRRIARLPIPYPTAVPNVFGTKMP